jgi:hypothetical protein
MPTASLRSPAADDDAFLLRGVNITLEARGDLGVNRGHLSILSVAVPLNRAEMLPRLTARIATRIGESS